MWSDEWWSSSPAGIALSFVTNVSSSMDLYCFRKLVSWGKSQECNDREWSGGTTTLVKAFWTETGFRKYGRSTIIGLRSSSMKSFLVTIRRPGKISSVMGGTKLAIGLFWWRAFLFRLGSRKMNRFRWFQGNCGIFDSVDKINCRLDQWERGYIQNMRRKFS